MGRFAQLNITGTRQAVESVAALLLVVIATVAACTPPPCETCPTAPAEIEVTVCVDSAFSASENMAIDEAAADWTAALCGYVTLRPLRVPGDAPPAWCDVTLYRVQSWYDQVAQVDLADGDTLPVAGYADPSLRAAWIVTDRIPPASLRTVAAHEIGHLLGVSHGDGVMRDPLLPNSCLDRRAAVLAALRLGERSGLECYR